MHPYLPHLLSDIAAAHQNVPKGNANEQKTKKASLEQTFEEIDRWVAGEDLLHTVGYYCGLQPIDFPPTEQLENGDLEQVCEAFKQMMLSWNLAIELPDDLPLPMAYSLMVDLLNTKTIIPTNGTIVFDFCTGYTPECDLKSYCPCLEFWNEIDEDMPSDMDKRTDDTGDGNTGIWDQDELPF